MTPALGRARLRALLERGHRAVLRGAWQRPRLEPDADAPDGSGPRVPPRPGNRFAATLYPKMLGAGSHLSALGAQEVWELPRLSG